MSLKDVINRIALVSGLEQGEISKWIPIIMDSIKYFESKLRNCTYSDVDMMRLNHACAVFAYYKISMYISESQISDFKAGDVEISKFNGDADRARRMWESEKSDIADLMDTGDICFKRVRA